jgi:hypothetical protein
LLILWGKSFAARRKEGQSAAHFAFLPHPMTPTNSFLLAFLGGVTDFYKEGRKAGRRPV